MVELIKENTPYLSSPSIIIALDIIVQRAMYEISDKLNNNISEIIKLGQENSPSEHNLNLSKPLENCVSFLTHITLPLCNLFQNLFSLQFLGNGSNCLGYKMITLNRQLMELISWTSLIGQSLLPVTFPYSILSNKQNDNQSLVEKTINDDSLKQSSSPSSFNTQKVESISFENFKKITSILDDGLISHIFSKVPTAEEDIKNKKNFNNFPKKNPIRINGSVSNDQYFLNSISKILQQKLFKVTKVNSKILNVGSSIMNFSPTYLQPGNNTNQYVYPTTLDFVSTSVIDNDLPINNFSPISNPLPKDNSTSLEQFWRPKLRNNIINIKHLIESELNLNESKKHCKACLKDFEESIINFSNLLRNEILGTNQFIKSDEKSLNSQHINALINSLKNDFNITNQVVEKILVEINSKLINKFKMYPSLESLLKKFDQSIYIYESKKKEHHNHLKKIVRNLEKEFKETPNTNILNPKSIWNRSRFIYLSFDVEKSFLVNDSSDSRQYPVSCLINCNLYLEDRLPFLGHQLILLYINFDNSNKLLNFFHLVNHFVHAHGIVDSSKGFLSMFTWYVMIIHFLLKKKIVPFLHNFIYDNHHQLFNPNSKVTFPIDSNQDYSEYYSKIANVSLTELLDEFFRYYVEEFDTFSSIITIRPNALVINKYNPMNSSSTFPSPNCVMWRLSIEDPFLDPCSIYPPDLGSSLSRPSQLTTFKALRRGLFAIRSISILIQNSLDSDKEVLNISGYVKQLFSRTELIQIARKSDYTGAAMLTPKPLKFSKNFTYQTIDLSYWNKPFDPIYSKSLEYLNNDDTFNSILNLQFHNLPETKLDNNYTNAQVQYSNSNPFIPNIKDNNAPYQDNNVQYPTTIKSLNSQDFSNNISYQQQNSNQPLFNNFSNIFSNSFNNLNFNYNNYPISHISPNYSSNNYYSNYYDKNMRNFHLNTLSQENDQLFSFNQNNNVYSNSKFISNNIPEPINNNPVNTNSISYNHFWPNSSIGQQNPNTVSNNIQMEYSNNNSSFSSNNLESFFSDMMTDRDTFPRKKSDRENSKIDPSLNFNIK